MINTAYATPGERVIALSSNLSDQEIEDFLRPYGLDSETCASAAEEFLKRKQRLEKWFEAVARFW